MWYFTSEGCLSSQVDFCSLSPLAPLVLCPSQGWYVCMQKREREILGDSFSLRPLEAHLSASLVSMSPSTCTWSSVPAYVNIRTPSPSPPTTKSSAGALSNVLSQPCSWSQSAKVSLGFPLPGSTMRIIGQDLSWDRQVLNTVMGSSSQSALCKMLSFIQGIEKCNRSEGT